MIKITKIYLLNSKNIVICAVDCNEDILRTKLENYRKTIKENDINKPAHVYFEYKTF